MRRCLISLAALVVVAAMSVPPAGADGKRATYQYLAGSGFICDLDEPNPCPDVAQSPRGDTVEVAGEGTFTTQHKSVTGGGTFVHRLANGTVVGRGNWRATRLLSFHSYGSGAAQGLPPETTGGRALLRIRLDPDGPEGERRAILTITCAIGDKIPAGAEEGVRLKVPGVGNFNREVSGLTLFIRL